MPAIYCIDTSCLIAAWDERYPIDNFPNFWSLIDGAIEAAESSRRRPCMMKPRKIERPSRLAGRSQSDVFGAGRADPARGESHSGKAPALGGREKQRFAADPFIIAAARLQSLTIVTEERPTGSINRPNIPDVCGDYGISYINLLQLIRAEAWVI